jgi:hypothetical protein
MRSTRTPRGVDLEAGDGRSAGDVARAGLETELFECVEDAALHGEQLVGVRALASAGVGRIEQVERRHLVVLDMDVGHGAERAGFFFLRRGGGGRFFDRGGAGIDDLGFGERTFGNSFFFLRRFLLCPGVFGCQRLFAGARRSVARPAGARRAGQRFLHGGFLLQADPFQLGLAPFAEPRGDGDHEGFEKFHRVHPCHEDQAGEVENGEQDGRADDAEQSGQHGLAESEADPPAGTEDVEVRFPGLEKPRLDAGEAGAGEDERADPGPAFAVEGEGAGQELAAAETDENDGQQVGGRPKQEVTQSGHHGTDRADEVFRRTARAALFAEEQPRRDVLGVIRDEGEEEQGAGAEQDEPEHFTPRLAASFFCCFTAGQGVIY